MVRDPPLVKTVHEGEASRDVEFWGGRCGRSLRRSRRIRRQSRPLISGTIVPRLQDGARPAVARWWPRGGRADGRTPDGREANHRRAGEGPAATSLFARVRVDYNRATGWSVCHLLVSLLQASIPYSFYNVRLAFRLGIPGRRSGLWFWS
eukprot:SAG22_NODE_9112_length_609_cov_1.509804_1_plen_149_part_01